MAQWINLHRNNIFVNWTRLPLLCEKSGAILLVLVGLTAAWQAGSPAVRRNKGRFEKFWNPLLIALLGILRRFTKVQCYCSVTNVFQSFSSGKAYCEVCCGGTKKVGRHVFSCRSLLLSTTVLNDINGFILQYFSDIL